MIYEHEILNPPVVVKDAYSLNDLAVIQRELHQCGTFNFPTCDESGLFPGAAVAEDHYTGYEKVWVRDNVHIAHAMLVDGKERVALRAVEALARHFAGQRPRFQRIIDRDCDPADPMNRPHVRFDGRTLRESPESWSHDQNDALGYFLWLYCRLVRDGHVALVEETRHLLGLMLRYFTAIEYWQDRDSGHWEEDRKVNASSIGVVLGGLLELRGVAAALSPMQRDEVTGGEQRLEELIVRGKQSLDRILPSESIEPVERQYDAALLFLVYPVGVVAGDMADTIVQRVTHHLQGHIGIRRYLGDSFWAPDYKKKLSPDRRTSDWSDDIGTRNALAEEGKEAQ